MEELILQLQPELFPDALPLFFLGMGDGQPQKAECTVPGIQFFHQGAGQGENSFFLRQDFRNGRAAGLLDKVRELNLQGKGVSPEAGTGQPPREFFRQQGRRCSSASALVTFSR